VLGFAVLQSRCSRNWPLRPLHLSNARSEPLFGCQLYLKLIRAWGTGSMRSSLKPPCVCHGRMRLSTSQGTRLAPLPVPRQAAIFGELPPSPARCSADRKDNYAQNQGLVFAPHASMSGAAARKAQVRGMGSGEPSAIQPAGRLATCLLVVAPLTPPPICSLIKTDHSAVCSISDHERKCAKQFRR